MDADQVQPVDSDDPAVTDGGPGRVRSVANQLAWLTAAGFDENDCLWLQVPLALLAAIA